MICRNFNWFKQGYTYTSSYLNKNKIALNSILEWKFKGPYVNIRTLEALRHFGYTGKVMFDLDANLEEYWSQIFYENS